MIIIITAGSVTPRRHDPNQIYGNQESTLG